MGKLQTVNPSHQCCEQQKWKLLDTVVPVALQLLYLSRNVQNSKLSYFGIQYLDCFPNRDMAKFTEPVFSDNNVSLHSRRPLLLALKHCGHQPSMMSQKGSVPIQVLVPHTSHPPCFKSPNSCDNHLSREDQTEPFPLTKRLNSWRFYRRTA